MVKSSRMNAFLVSTSHLDAPHITLAKNTYTVGLDGSLIVLSMVVLNIFHPGRLMIRGFGFKKFTSQSAIGNVTKEVEVFSFPDTK